MTTRPMTLPRPYSAPVALLRQNDALVFLGILRDLIVDRRVHKVYLYAFPLLIVVQVFCMQTFLHASPWWVRIANAVLR